MMKHNGAWIAGGAAVVLWLLAAERLTAGVQDTSTQLRSALSLDVEVVRHRRCYNDVSSTTDVIDTRLIFTNVSSRPIAVRRNQRGIVYRTRLEPSRGVERGEPPPTVIISHDPLFGNGDRPSGDPAQPERDDIAVLLPKDALALVTTLSLRVLRPGSVSDVTPLARRLYGLSVAGELRVAEYESEAQPPSGARSLTLDSRPIPLDLSASLPLEFCESSDRSSR